VVQTFARLFPPAPLNQSAESAIGFCGRLQRLHSTGLCSLGVVFDPHRPYQDLHKRKGLASTRCSNHYL